MSLTHIAAKSINPPRGLKNTGWARISSSGKDAPGTLLPPLVPASPEIPQPWPHRPVSPIQQKKAQRVSMKEQKWFPLSVFSVMKDGMVTTTHW